MWEYVGYLHHSRVCDWAHDRFAGVLKRIQLCLFWIFSIVIFRGSVWQWTSRGAYILWPTYLETPEDVLVTVNIMRLTKSYVGAARCRPDNRHDLDSAVSRSFGKLVA